MPAAAKGGNGSKPEESIEELRARLAALEGGASGGRGAIATGEDRRHPEDAPEPEEDMGPEVPLEAQADAYDAPAAPRGRGRPPKEGSVRGRGRPPKEQTAAEPMVPAHTPAQPPASNASRAVAQPRAAHVPGLVGMSDEMLALYQADAGKGVNFAADDLVIPRLILLQDNSPQVKEGTLGHIPGARPGLMMNSVTQEIVAKAQFIPLRYTRRFVGWRPRDERGGGGGLFRPDVPREEFEQMEEVRIGKRVYVDPRGGGQKNGKDVPGEIEVVDTPEWSGFVSFDGGKSYVPIAVDMAGSKAKIAGKLNTLISMQTVRAADGSEFTLPCFASVFEIATAREGEGADSYFNYALTLAGRVTDVNLYNRARKLQQQFAAGDVEIVPPSGDV